MKHRCLFFFAVFALFSANLWASDSCDAVLIPTNFRSYDNTSIQMQMLKLIDSSNYSEVSNKIGGSVTVPIQGVPVSFGGDYNTFNQQRQSVLQKDSLNVSNSQVRDTVATFLPSAIADAWRDCMVAKKSGLILEPTYSSAQAIVVHGSWYPSASVGDLKLDQVFLQGGTQTGIPQSVVSNGDFTFVVDRKAGEELLLIVQSSQGYSASVTLPIYSRDVLLQPIKSPSIACGKVTPNLYVLATNHNNGHRDNYYETQEAALTEGSSSDASKADSYGGGEGGADASLKSICRQVVKDSNNRVITEVSLKGHIHAATGNGFAGTGFHPGGGAGVYPSWEGKLSLPGTKNWKLNADVTNGLIDSANFGVDCTLKVDGLSVNTITAKVGQTQTMKIDSLAPGDYAASLDCKKPPIDFPFKAAQAIALWSGNPGEQSKDVEVQLRIDAQQ
jgi:hypothetical protein